VRGLVACAAVGRYRGDWGRKAVSWPQKREFLAAVLPSPRPNAPARRAAHTRAALSSPAGAVPQAPAGVPRAAVAGRASSKQRLQPPVGAGRWRGPRAHPVKSHCKFLRAASQGTGCRAQGGKLSSAGEAVCFGRRPPDCGWRGGGRPGAARSPRPAGAGAGVGPGAWSGDLGSFRSPLAGHGMGCGNPRAAPGGAPRQQLPVVGVSGGVSPQGNLQTPNQPTTNGPAVPTAICSQHSPQTPDCRGP
jgi:hypothetical protein